MFYLNERNAHRAARKEYEETGVPVTVVHKNGRYYLESVFY